jgi:hypothetical protein
MEAIPLAVGENKFVDRSRLLNLGSDMFVSRNFSKRLETVLLLRHLAGVETIAWIAGASAWDTVKVWLLKNGFKANRPEVRMFGDLTRPSSDMPLLYTVTTTLVLDGCRRGIPSNAKP